jgi:hypothetical protein
LHAPRSPQPLLPLLLLLLLCPVLLLLLRLLLRPQVRQARVAELRLVHRAHQLQLSLQPLVHLQQSLGLDRTRRARAGTCRSGACCEGSGRAGRVAVELGAVRAGAPSILAVPPRSHRGLRLRRGLPLPLLRRLLPCLRLLPLRVPLLARRRRQQRALAGLHMRAGACLRACLLLEGLREQPVSHIGHHLVHR